MNHRQLKDRLYTLWAEVAKALGSPKRVELLDLLAQGERTVEQLAREAGLTINNTSSHLSVLKAARLVDTRKSAQFVFHRLADDAVVGLLRELQALARSRIYEVEHLAQQHLEGRDPLEPLSARELQHRLRVGDVTVIDVRPELEFEAGHIAGARSLPLEQLDRRLGELPDDELIVAYCRGPYCMFAVEAVERLRRRGYDARRLIDGLPDWRAAGFPVAAGPEQPPRTPRRSTRRPRPEPSPRRRTQ